MKTGVKKRNFQSLEDDLFTAAATDRDRGRIKQRRTGQMVSACLLVVDFTHCAPNNRQWSGRKRDQLQGSRQLSKPRGKKSFTFLLLFGLTYK